MESTPNDDMDQNLNSQKSIDFKLSEAQIEELKKREKEYLAGQGISYTWEQVEKMLKAKRKRPNS